MKIDFGLIALIGFVFYFGYKTSQNKEAVLNSIGTEALNTATDYTVNQADLTKQWAQSLSNYWKSVWK